MDSRWQSWHQEVLCPIMEHRSGNNCSTALKILLESNDADLALLAADTDRTQDYVMESARLPEIRGASNQLRAANDDWLTKRIHEAVGYDKGKDNDCIIFASGGGLLALLPRAVAEELQPELEAIFPEHTTTATITIAWRAVTPRMIIEAGYPTNEDAPFGSVVKWAGTWLNRRKESRQITQGNCMSYDKLERTLSK